MNNLPLSCPFCKSELEPGALACEVCGRSLSDAVGLPAQGEQSRPDLLAELASKLPGVKPSEPEPPSAPPTAPPAQESFTFGSFPTESGPATPRQILILVGAVLIVACFLVVAGTMIFQMLRTRFGEQAASASQTAQVLERDVRRTEVSAEQTQAWADYQARTTEEARAQESAQALQEIRTEAQSWTVILDENFEGEDSGWYVDEGEDDLSYYAYRVEDGVYRLEMTAKTGLSQWFWPDIVDISLDSFYYAADMQMSGPNSMDGGLIFNLGGEDDTDFYLFDITRNAEFAIYLHANDEWTLLTDYFTTSAISTDAKNRLEIIGRPSADGLGQEFFFFINGEFVTQINDNTLEHNWVGIQVGLSEQGDQGFWDFDNVILRVP